MDCGCGLVIGECHAGPSGGFLAARVAGEFVQEASAIHVYFRMRPDANCLTKSMDAPLGGYGSVFVVVERPEFFGDANAEPCEWRDEGDAGQRGEAEERFAGA